MCVRHRYKGKISPQGRGKLLRLVLVYDTYTVSRNVPSYPGNEEALGTQTSLPPSYSGSLCVEKKTTLVCINNKKSTDNRTL